MLDKEEFFLGVRKPLFLGIRRFHFRETVTFYIYLFSFFFYFLNLHTEIHISMYKLLPGFNPRSSHTKDFKNDIWYFLAKHSAI